MGTFLGFRANTGFAGFAGSLLLLCIVAPFVRIQNPISKEDAAEIFDGIEVDVTRAIEAIEARGITPYDFGMDLFAAGDVEGAKKWFQTLAIATEDLQYLYGLAWVKWKTGDTLGALQDCAYILSQESASDLLRARIHYLMGSSSFDGREMEKAEKYFRKGIELYKKLGKYGGQYLCLIELAKVEAERREYDHALETLEKAMSANERLGEKGIEPYGHGRYWELVGNIRFLQRDFEGALHANEMSEAAYRKSGEIFQSDEVLAKMGLLKFMMGYPREASEIASDLWDRFHNDTARLRLMAYNNVTLMALDRCSQEPESAQQRKESALTWANHAPDGKYLEEILDYVEKHVPCPEWR